MPQALNRFRTPKAPAPRLYQLLRTAGVFLLGLVLGLLAKWLDTIPHDGSLKSLLLAQTGQFLSRLGAWAFIALLLAVFSAGPLRASLNVAGFFAGMLLGYYWYTTVLFGFFPRRYATVWIIIAAAASALAWLIWYARGSGWFPAFISAIIIGFFITQAFSLGMWYVDLREFPELFLLFASSAVLYREPKQFLYAVLGGVLFAPVLSALFSYVFGGL